MRHIPPDLAAVAATLVEGLRPKSALKKPLVIVPDSTRDIGLATLLPPVVEALRKQTSARVRVVFASGTHRVMSSEERTAAMGPVANAVDHVAHDCDDDGLIDLGGGPLHPWVGAADSIVVLSGLTLHYLAGVGGGRKMIFPGITSRDVATAVHSHSMAADGSGRAAGIGPGVVKDNPMHAAIMKRVKASRLPPMALALIEATHPLAVTRVHTLPSLSAGFADVAAAFVERRTVTVDQMLDGVVVDAAGAAGVNLVQAHKALNAVAEVVRPGGRIVVNASLRDGTGNERFPTRLKEDSAVLLCRLQNAFSIGEQTAWSLRRLLSRYRVRWCSDRPSVVTECGLEAIESSETNAWIAAAGPNIGISRLGATARYRHVPREIESRPTG